MNKTQLLQGTLDLLILRILERGPSHGWGIFNRLPQISQNGLTMSQGSRCPALHTISRAGRRRLNKETETWEAFALAMRRVLEEGQ